MDAVATPSDGGYYLLGSDGGVFAFDAPFVGSVLGVLAHGVSLTESICDMVAHGDGS